MSQLPQTPSSTTWLKYMSDTIVRLILFLTRFLGASNSKNPNQRIPIVVVVKCGTPDEAESSKPGNRGKRDSQVILMNFFSRVILNDHMTPLDFDLFRKIHFVTGVTPDFYETVLMVDADTQVAPMSMRLMTNAMHNEPLIMGLCGETKLGNKTASWVTRIQIFEYYISHHLYAFKVQ
jgi:chitin synthase